MSEGGPWFSWNDEKSIDELLAEADRLITDDNHRMMWRLASRISITARGHAKGVRADDCRPAVIEFAERLAASGLLAGNRAAFVFYWYVTRVKGVEFTPMREALASDDQFRKVHAAEALAYVEPPDPAAIPLLDELLRGNPEMPRWQRARARFERPTG